MIVAVPVVRVMQVAIDEVVHVIAMRHLFVAAARAMAVTVRVRAAIVRGRALVGIVRVHRHDVLVHVIAVLVMQVAVVQVVDVALVLHTRVSAVGTMNVVVLFVGLVVCHCPFSSGVPVFLVRVLQGVADQLQDMNVCERVIDVSTLSTPPHEPFAAKEAKSMRHRGHALVARRRELADARLTPDEHVERSKPRSVAQRPEQTDRSIDGPRRVLRGRRRSVLPRLTASRGGDFLSFRHLVICSSVVLC